jgi:hypothetical protein
VCGNFTLPGPNSIWEWSKPFKLPYDWGNKHPLTNHYTVPRVRGFHSRMSLQQTTPKKIKSDYLRLLLCIIIYVVFSDNNYYISQKKQGCYCALYCVSSSKLDLVRPSKNQRGLSHDFWKPLIKHMVCFEGITPQFETNLQGSSCGCSACERWT